MARSVWKGPFVDPSLLKKVEKEKAQSNPKPIKTWSRKSTIIPDFVGLSFLIYNGKKFIPLTVSEDMVGHKFGEFSPTRTFNSHSAVSKSETRPTSTATRISIPPGTSSDKPAPEKSADDKPKEESKEKKK